MVNLLDNAFGGLWVDTSNPVNLADHRMDGCVERWKFIEGLDGGKYLYGLMGRNHGTLTSGPTWQRPRGRHGGFGSIKFTGGTANHLNCGNSAYDIRTVATNPFSLAAWIYVDTFRGGGTGVFQILTIGTDNYVSASFATQDQKVTFIADGDGVGGWDMGTAGIGATLLTTGTWYHVGITRNTAGVYTAYVNGKSDGTVTFSTNLQLNSQLIKIGCHYALNTTYDTDGLIDDVIFDSKCLSAGEMFSRFQATRQLHDPTMNWVGTQTVAPAVAEAAADPFGAGRYYDMSF